MTANALRFQQLMTAHDDLVRRELYSRKLTAEEQDRLLAIEAEIEALCEAEAAAHYATAEG